jgi:hypothetical protein
MRSGHAIVLAVGLVLVGGAALADPVTELHMEQRRQQGLQQLHNDVMRDANRAFVPTQRDFQRIQDYNNQLMTNLARQAALRGAVNVQPVPHHRHHKSARHTQAAAAEPPREDRFGALWPMGALGVAGLVGGALWRRKKPARPKAPAKKGPPKRTGR